MNPSTPLPAQDAAARARAQGSAPVADSSLIIHPERVDSEAVLERFLHEYIAAAEEQRRTILEELETPATDQAEASGA